MRIVNYVGALSAPFEDALRDVRCEAFTGDLAIDGNTGSHACWLQIRERSRTGEQHGRKWMLSKYMTPDEVRQTAFAALLAFHEHELREAFTYKGVAILGPHLAHDKLVELHATGEALSVRL